MLQALTWAHKRVLRVVERTLSEDAGAGSDAKSAAAVDAVLFANAMEDELIFRTDAHVKRHFVVVVPPTQSEQPPLPSGKAERFITTLQNQRASAVFLTRGREHDCSLGSSMAVSGYHGCTSGRASKRLL